MDNQVKIDEIRVDEETWDDLDVIVEQKIKWVKCFFKYYELEREIERKEKVLTNIQGILDRMDSLNEDELKKNIFNIEKKRNFVNTLKTTKE